MSDQEVLTRDNSLLSRPTMGDFEGQNSSDLEPSSIVREYVRDAISDNTKRAYRSDLRHFMDWGGMIPSSDVMLADYLAHHAGVLSVATLVRRVASISKAHSAKGLSNPARSALVKSPLRGIQRTHGPPPGARPCTNGSRRALGRPVAATARRLRGTFGGGGGMCPGSRGGPCW